MLRNKPILNYCGLTIILSNVSRFDKINLLSGPAGVLINSWCLQPFCNSMQCDIQLADSFAGFIPETKAVILCGEYAMWKFCPQTKDNSLNEMRGSPLYVNELPAIATFFPQDCCDIKSYEQQLNEQSKDYNVEEEKQDDGDTKRYSPTTRSNYAFWIKQDFNKVKKLLLNGETKWPVEQQPIYRTYPPLDEVIEALKGHKDEYFYFDIETDIEEQNIQCFSFSFDGRIVYNVPILDYNYKWAYSNLHHIFRSLCNAVKQNIIVAHNGASFDCFILSLKYHIPVYRVYDTMLATHRCFPDVEKSLGHSTSLWTYQSFHKDEDSQGYRTNEQMYKRLQYCGKDVFTMFLIKQAIDKHAKRIPGLQQSIDCVNRSIVPYIVTSLQGIRYSQERLQKIKDYNDKLMTQYLRCINLLIGEEGMAEVRSIMKNKNTKAFPMSNPQCVNYFHNILEYPVMARGKPNKKTGDRAPSLAKKAMYRLALKYENPVIRFSLLFRELRKEYGSLEFNPWRDDNNSIIPKQYE
jgi:hypothetical protein